MKRFNWEIKFNNQSIGKTFITKKEAKTEFNRLWDLGLYGYTLNKIQ